MLSPNNKKLEKLDPFYRPSASKQKTSAEIISEARNALRAVRTQRPFTPREDQRTLFGPASSRTPESRPPSSFSLHTSSFELSDSRPTSGARLSPLELKPRAPAAPSTDGGPCASFPTPTADPAKMRSRAPPPARTPPPAGAKKTVISKQTVMMGDSTVKINGLYLTRSNAIGHFKNHPLQLTYGGVGEIKEQEIFKGATCLPSHLRGGGAPGERRPRASSCPTSLDPGRLETTAVSKADLQEKDTEIEAEEAFWNTRIVPILHELEKEENIETVCAACTQLHCALQEGDMLRSTFKRRSILLKTLYKLVDVGSDLLSLKLAKIILALKVSRKNLLNVCKLIFKISRNEKNDSLIQNDSILESLLEVLRNEDLQANSEAFLYCMGAIKFISGNPGFLNEMISKGAVEILMNLIKQINENTRKCGTCLPNSGHLLVQMTSALRNLVDSPRARSTLLHINALPELCTAMGQCLGDTDVCTNIARILSKLTSYHDCCVALANYSRCYALFLKLINKYQKKQDLVVRIVFILGNLTAKDNQAREQLSREEGSTPTLLALFHTFSQLDVHMEHRAAEGGGQAEARRLRAQAEDVLLKLTRLLANLAIHPGAGRALASNPHVVGLLLATLEHKSVAECEALVVNATAAINNLSYYRVESSGIRRGRLHLAALLMKLLASNSRDGVLEAVRVFGNLSQDQDVCSFIVQKRVHKFMMALLDSKHQDICFSACGVLLNLTVDEDRRVILKEEGGVKKLVECLRDLGPTDWQLASLVCKTLWNLSENLTAASSGFGDGDTHSLSILLSSFLDEELALDGSFGQDLKSYHKLHWETEFKPVAQQLLSRLRSRRTFLERLPSPAV
ncbi:armadillo repeat-containing protein 2 [Manis pentadactyla]|uniref:armadillo repeat-containing protein 2 n=1 Tax=Manis pentadactyla TaxID=143292 RepID=UPI00255C2861|nr:armadillo repeat-containing protein 2 [Manis pentadactyla]KAI5140328.1 Armadillo Repeat-Containing Protein 2 [Manis pentadactyla]